MQGVKDDLVYKVGYSDVSSILYSGSKDKITIWKQFSTHTFRVFKNISRIGFAFSKDVFVFEFYGKGLVEPDFGEFTRGAIKIKADTQIHIDDDEELSTHVLKTMIESFFANDLKTINEIKWWAEDWKNVSGYFQFSINENIYIVHTVGQNIPKVGNVLNLKSTTTAEKTVIARKTAPSSTTAPTSKTAPSSTTAPTSKTAPSSTTAPTSKKGPIKQIKKAKKKSKKSKKNKKQKKIEIKKKVKKIKVKTGAQKAFEKFEKKYPTDPAVQASLNAVSTASAQNCVTAIPLLLPIETVCLDNYWNMNHYFNMNIDSGILEWQTHFMGIFWKYDYKKQLKDIRPFVFHSPSLTLWMPLLIEEIYIGLKLLSEIDWNDAPDAWKTLKLDDKILDIHDEAQKCDFIHAEDVGWNKLNLSNMDWFTNIDELVADFQYDESRDRVHAQRDYSQNEMYLIHKMFIKFPEQINRIIIVLLAQFHLRAFVISGGQRWAGFIKAYVEASANTQFASNWEALSWTTKQSFRWQALWSVDKGVVDLASRKINVMNAEHNTSPIVTDCLLAGARLLSGTVGSYWSSRQWRTNIKNMHGDYYKQAVLHVVQEINRELKSNFLETLKIKKEGWQKRLLMTLIFGDKRSIQDLYLFLKELVNGHLYIQFLASTVKITDKTKQYKRLLESFQANEPISARMSTKDINKNVELHLTDFAERCNKMLVSVHMWKAIPILVYMRLNGIKIFKPYAEHQKAQKVHGKKTKILTKDCVLDMIQLEVVAATFPFALHRLFVDENEMLLTLLKYVGIGGKRWPQIWKV